MKIIRGMLFYPLMNELESGAGEAASATTASPPTPTSFSDVWVEARAQMDAARKAAPPATVAPPAPLAPVVTPSAAPLVPQAPAPAASPAPTPEAAALAQQQAALVRALDSIATRLAPPPAPAPPQAAPRFDTAEAMVDFRPPLPTQGETQEAYDVRVQAASVDHLLAKRDEYFANHVMQQRIQQAFAERDAAAARQQQQGRLNLMLDTEIEAAGIPRNTRAFQLAKHAVHAELVHRARDPSTAQWGEAEIRSFMRSTASELRPPVAAPAPPAAPHLSLVRTAPPVSGSGGTGAGASPPAQNTGPAPSSFTEMFSRMG